MLFCILLDNRSSFFGIIIHKNLLSTFWIFTFNLNTTLNSTPSHYKHKLTFILTKIQDHTTILDQKIESKQLYCINNTNLN